MKKNAKELELVSMKINIRAIVLTVIFLLNAISAFSQSQTSSGIPVSVQEDPRNELGLIHTVKKLEEASNLIKGGNIPDAEKIVLSAKNWLTELTNYHYELYQSLSMTSKTISESKIEKAHALDFANARDESYFLLAKIYIVQNKLKDAVKLLVNVIKSQNDTELSREAYKTLQEIKFSDKAN